MTDKEVEAVDSAILIDSQLMITTSKAQGMHSIDFQRVLVNWHIDQRIVGEEQDHQERVAYGKYMIKN